MDTSPAGQLPILVRLKSQLVEMPPALARVAKYVVNYPRETVGLSIEALSEITESGQASIIRLMRSLGFTGFRTFKLALSAQLGGATSSAGTAENGDIVQRVRREMVGSLDETAALVDRGSLRAAAAVILSRQHVNVYAGGVSAMIGDVLAARLLRLGVWARCFADTNIGLEVIAPVSRHAVAVALSDSGATPEPIRMLRAARSAGAATIAITSRPASPVALHADIVLRTAPILQPPSGGFVTSIAAQVFVIQLLVEHVATAGEDG